MAITNRRFFDTCPSLITTSPSSYLRDGALATPPPSDQIEFLRCSPLEANVTALCDVAHQRIAPS